MTMIRNISYKNDKTIVKLNNINSSIVNAIRRIIISEVNTLGISDDTNSIQIFKNTTSYHNEYLSHRISMIPLYISELTIKDFDPEKYKFVIHKKNDKNEYLYITSNDFKVYVKNDENEWIEEEESKFFKKDKLSQDYILICKLNDNSSELHLECKATLQKGQFNSHFSPVSICVLVNSIDDSVYKEKLNIYLKDCSEDKKEDKIKEFDSCEKEKCFSLDEKGEPNSFELIFESIGYLTPTYIFIESLSILKEKMNTFHTNIQEDKYIMSWSNKVKFKAIDIIIPNEDDTLGNLIQYLIYDSFMHKQVSFIGYDKEHPLDDYLVIRLSLINDSLDLEHQKKEIRKIASSIVDRMKDILSNLEKEWTSIKKKIIVKK